MNILQYKNDVVKSLVNQTFSKKEMVLITHMSWVKRTDINVKEPTFELCDCEPQQISKEEENPIAPASSNKKDTDKIIIDHNY